MRTLIQSKAILLSYSPLIGFAILAPAVVAVVFVVVVVVVVDVVGATRNGISGRYAAHGIGLPRDLIRWFFLEIFDRNSHFDLWFFSWSRFPRFPFSTSFKVRFSRFTCQKNHFNWISTTTQQKNKKKNQLLFELDQNSISRIKRDPPPPHTIKKRIINFGNVFRVASASAGWAETSDWPLGNCQWDAESKDQRAADFKGRPDFASRQVRSRIKVPADGVLHLFRWRRFLAVASHWLLLIP